MSRLFPLLIILMLPVLPSSAMAQAPIPVFDGRLSLKPATPTGPEIGIFTEQVLPAAKNYWEQRGQAVPDFGCEQALPLDMAKGSFTRPGAQQLALLYRYCTTGHNMALNGIAVTENGRIVAHAFYAGAWDNALGALPDINANGISEIILAGGGTNMGQTWKSAAIIELAGAEVLSFGRVQTYLDNCGITDKEGLAQAWRLLVQPGPSPVFFREGFRAPKACSQAGAWRHSSPLARISLDTDEIEYDLNK